MSNTNDMGSKTLLPESVAWDSGFHNVLPNCSYCHIFKGNNRSSTGWSSKKYYKQDDQ